MTSCPSCSKPKTARALLCAACRKLAIEIGVQLLVEPGTTFGSLLERIAERIHPAARTPGQNRAYHGKCGELARLEEITPTEVKARALQHASTELGRDVTSSKELNEDEMSDLLDWLDEQITDVAAR